MTDAIVWYGRMVSRRRLLTRGAFTVAAGVLWILVFLVLPSLGLLALAFMSRGAYGQVECVPTVENFSRLLGFGIMGWSADHLFIVLRSVVVATVTTLLCVAVAYPLAFFIAGRSPRTRVLWLTLVVVPMATNAVIRTYGWMLLFSPGLPFARLAAFLGCIPPDGALYPGTFATFVGILGLELPFAVLPLYTNVERLDWSLVEAARDLYASPVRVFLHGILPQTLPGLLAAVTMTFVPAMGMFVVPDLLGGAKHWLVGNLIQQQFGASRDYPFGAAVSLVLVVLSLAGLVAMRRAGDVHRAEGVAEP